MMGITPTPERHQVSPFEAGTTLLRSSGRPTEVCSACPAGGPRADHGWSGKLLHATACALFAIRWPAQPHGAESREAGSPTDAEEMAMFAADTGAARVGHLVSDTPTGGRQFPVMVDDSPASACACSLTRRHPALGRAAN